jgi:hypothetical protein
MSAVPELLTEGVKYTWKQITGDRKRLKKANHESLGPQLARKPFMMPDGTALREMVVTGEEVSRSLGGLPIGYRGGARTHVDRR